MSKRLPMQNATYAMCIETLPGRLDIAVTQDADNIYLRPCHPERRAGVVVAIVLRIKECLSRQKYG